ncbi:hypothetical protein XENTR_v10002403 [Xenopus tropicalis]|nr:hypothetical protein XENTR_v10002403 [Xenopus tropicalis]
MACSNWSYSFMWISTNGFIVGIHIFYDSVFVFRLGTNLQLVTAVNKLIGKCCMATENPWLVILPTNLI